jgi:hypothetical protein
LKLSLKSSAVVYSPQGTETTLVKTMRATTQRKYLSAAQADTAPLAARNSLICGLKNNVKYYLNAVGNISLSLCLKPSGLISKTDLTY